MNRIAGTITAVVGETPTQRDKLSALSAGGTVEGLRDQRRGSSERTAESPAGHCGDRLVRSSARLLEGPPLELPGREAPDVEVELVEPWVVVITSELNLELHLVACDG